MLKKHKTSIQKFGDWKVCKNYIRNVKLDYLINKSQLLENSNWISHIQEKIKEWDVINFCKAHVCFLQNIVCNEKNITKRVIK